MLFSLIAISGFFKIPDQGTKGILIGVFSIVFFVFFYSIGAGPIPFTLSAEVFPLCVRGKSITFYFCHQRGLTEVRGRNELQRYDQFPWSWTFGALWSSVDLGIQWPGKSFVFLFVRFGLLCTFAQILTTAQSP
jgi:hypothetical protein